MHNVFRHIVITGGDKNLGAGDLIAAIVLGLCLGAQHAKVSTAVGFGQAHGAGPLTTHQFGKIDILLLFGTVGLQGVHRPVAKAGIHTP